MGQWFISFLEFAEFTEFLIHLEKTPISPITVFTHNRICLLLGTDITVQTEVSIS